MRKVRYGNRWIEYSIEERQGLKWYYISVERHSGVVLKGIGIKTELAIQVVLKKAKWILDKLNLVRFEKHAEIVTGSRLMYLGKSYYVEVIKDPVINNVVVSFNYSRFKIQLNPDATQVDIKAALEIFYKEKAVEKLTQRVQILSDRTSLPYNGLSFRKMARRWGSCTPGNKIIINYDAVKLPYSLINYSVVHELCHTKIKDHSKAFWSLLRKHEPKWKELDSHISEIKF